MEAVSVFTVRTSIKWVIFCRKSFLVGTMAVLSPKLIYRLTSATPLLLCPPSFLPWLFSLTSESRLDTGTKLKKGIFLCILAHC